MDPETPLADLLGLVWISRFGTTSYVVSHELVQDGRVAVYVEATVVVLDVSTRKPAPIDPEFLRRLELYKG